MAKKLSIILVTIAACLGLAVFGCQYDAMTDLGLATGSVRSIDHGRFQERKPTNFNRIPPLGFFRTCDKAKNLLILK